MSPKDVIQWSYISLIFTALLFTTLPRAIGGQLRADSITPNIVRSPNACYQEAGAGLISQKPFCEIKKLNMNDSTDEIHTFFKSLKKVFNQ